MDIIDLEIIKIDSTKELPKVPMKTRAEPKDSKWRPLSGCWYMRSDSTGAVYWHEFIRPPTLPGNLEEK